MHARFWWARGCSCGKCAGSHDARSASRLVPGVRAHLPRQGRLQRSARHRGVDTLRLLCAGQRPTGSCALGSAAVHQQRVMQRVRSAACAFKATVWAASSLVARSPRTLLGTHAAEHVLSRCSAFAPWPQLLFLVLLAITHAVGFFAGLAAASGSRHGSKHHTAARGRLARARCSRIERLDRTRRRAAVALRRAVIMLHHSCAPIASRVNTCRPSPVHTSPVNTRRLSTRVACRRSRSFLV